MNTQKPSQLSNDPSGIILLHSIFTTIQGEGVFAGHPATFVRLAGCNLACPDCDTEYTEGAMKVKPQYVLDAVNSITSPNKLIVITGGEPLRQRLAPLIIPLLEYGYTVQIESNGTLPPDQELIKLFELFSTKLYLMCSPKGRVHIGLTPYITAYKYVLDHDNVNAKDGLPDKVLGLKARVSRPHGGFDGPIFVQPADNKSEIKNLRNQHITIKSALEHGYIFCLQVHKVINME